VGVAGLGEVDDDSLTGVRERVGVDDVVGAVRRRDDDASLLGGRAQRIEADRAGLDVDCIGDVLRVGNRSIGDDEAVDLLGEGFGGQPSHLAGADDDAGRAVEGDFPGCESDRRGGQRQRPLVDDRLRARAFADVERLGDAVLQDGPEAVDGPGVLVGVSDLPEDLVLAEDDGLQARRHA